LRSGRFIPEETAIPIVYEAERGPEELSIPGIEPRFSQACTPHRHGFKLTGCLHFEF
jgi:hypothetical protein